ncbi:replication-associated protein [Army ant associated cyclovirus 9]|uniref:Replication-associated protein n=1 Tax=army ant associated cyclovirus 9 183_1 TaxID=3070169 RepID=A0AA47LW07_9CIRC|nr:replication-associated protein [Army ant associated cyclovirus 9]WBG01488.1 replication-associated protein [Army ant associated cyclovirus 9]
MALNNTLRRFCFTIPNYTDDDVRRVQEFAKNESKYFVYGREICPRTGTPHLQGLCNLQRPRRFNTVKRLLTSKAHIERAAASDQRNKEYCSKEGDVWEFGEPVGQGNRSDLQAVVDLVKNGERSIQRIADQCPIAFIKYSKGIKEYIKLVHPIADRDFKTDVYFYWGDPGSGKSRRALQEAEIFGGSIYYKPRGDWWDGYEQHDNVIIDDFYGWIKYDEMLKICDRYPYRVPIKGGYEIFTTKRIWITSNSPLDRIYRFIGYDCGALRRRLTKEEEMNYVYDSQ